MSRNSYFPPQPPPHQPSPSPFQAFSPNYPPPPPNPPSQQPWNHPPLCTSPPPSAPPTPYNPSAFTSPVLSPRDSFYQPRNPQHTQPRPQSSVYTGPAYSHPPGNAPPTPALSPSSSVPYGPSATTQYGYPPASTGTQPPAYIPYNPSGLNPREGTRPTSQCCELPSPPPAGQCPPPPALPPRSQPNHQQQPTQWSMQASFGQPQANGPPTPAYTPGPSGYASPNPVNANGAMTQYFPLQSLQQPTGCPPTPVLPQSSPGSAKATSKFAQKISSATQAQQPQECPPLQQAPSQDPAVFEISSHPSPPRQVQSRLSSSQAAEPHFTPLEEMEAQDQEAQSKPSPRQPIPSQVSSVVEDRSERSPQQAHPQSSTAQEHQSPPLAPPGVQSQVPAQKQIHPEHAQAEQVESSILPAEQIQPQLPPQEQIQDNWVVTPQASAPQASSPQAPAQESQSQFPQIQQLQPRYDSAQQPQLEPWPVQQVQFQPSTHQHVQPSTGQQSHPQSSSHERVQAQPLSAQPAYYGPATHQHVAQQSHSDFPPHQPVPQDPFQPPTHQHIQTPPAKPFQPQSPPHEQVQSQYAPPSQAQLSSSGGPPQYPPPPPYSQVPQATGAPPVLNQSMWNQQPPSSQSAPTLPNYTNEAQSLRTSYPQEKQEYEQSLVQSFEVQLQVTSTSQQLQDQQQYQPNQALPPYQQPQYPLSGEQTQEKKQYEQVPVQLFQQPWQGPPIVHPQEKQQYQPNQTHHTQQHPQYPGVGQPPPQYPPTGQPQPLYPPMGPQQTFGGSFMQGTSNSMPPPPPFIPSGALQPAKDDHKSSKTKRFLGDTLVGRVARSSVATVTSTVKMPLTLSPWGDNNPVTLPNVRYRDAVLFTTFAVVGGPLVDGASNLVTDTFGADTFISEIVSAGAGFITGNCIVKYGVFQIVEQAIDKGILEHILPEVEKTMRTTSVKSLQVSIKHKLMGVEADIRFVGTYPAASSMACDKGWFCPYLFASSRTPVIPRSNDFAVAQFFGPYVAADTALAHKILSESPCVIPLCDPDPTHHLPHSRLFIFFTGISPFRAGMWSTSRRPGCAQMIFHLLDGCPALVLPVATARTPVLAWSPWTLTQMQNRGASGYTPEKQIEQIVQWVTQLMEWPGLHPCIRNVSQAFDRIMWRVLSMMINGALAAPKGAEGKILGKIDAERAGIVMFRY